jgi:hypothetical protein
MVLLEKRSAPDMGEIQVVQHTDMTRYEITKQILRAETVRYFLTHELSLPTVA